jgi:hypothetical protein
MEAFQLKIHFYYRNNTGIKQPHDGNYITTAVAFMGHSKSQNFCLPMNGKNSLVFYP